MALRCKGCDNIISRERIEGYLSSVDRLPDRCVNCDITIKNVTFMVYGHKTAGEAVVVHGNNAEAVRQAKRAYARKR